MRADEIETLLITALTDEIATKNALIALIHAVKRSPDFDLAALKENLSAARGIPVIGIDAEGYRSNIDQFIEATK